MKSMFGFSVVLLLALIQNINADISPKMMPVIKKCAEEMDISMDYLVEHREAPEDKTCFYKCVAIKMGAMTEEGKEPLDTIKVKFDDHNVPEHIMANLDKCYHHHVDDLCQMAKNVWECLKKQD